MMEKDAKMPETTGVLESAESAMSAAKKLAEGNLGVFSAEFSAAIGKFRPRFARAAIYGSMFFMGLMSFVVFVIVGLGLLLDGRYWLSALIVAAIGCLVGGPLCVQSLTGISGLFNFERTIRSVDRTIETAKFTFEEIKATASGDNSESVATGKK